MSSQAPGSCTVSSHYQSVSQSDSWSVSWAVSDGYVFLMVDGELNKADPEGDQQEESIANSQARDGEDPDGLSEVVVKFGALTLRAAAGVTETA